MGVEFMRIILRLGGYTGIDPDQVAHNDKTLAWLSALGCTYTSLAIIAASASGCIRSCLAGTMSDVLAPSPHAPRPRTVTAGFRFDHRACG